MANFIGTVIGLVLAVVMVATVLIPTIKGTNTTGSCTQTAGTADFTCSPLVNATMVGAWGASEVAILALGSIIALAGLAYAVAAAFGLA